MKVLKILTGILIFLLPAAGAAQKGGAERGSAFLEAASGFIGLEVRDSGGVRIGEIRDILLDTQRERLAYAVIATGGVLGIGNEVVVVPWRFLKVEEDGKIATLPVLREKLLRTPKRDAAQSDEEFVRAVERFYGIPPYWEERPKKGRPTAGG